MLWVVGLREKDWIETLYQEHAQLLKNYVRKLARMRSLPLSAMDIDDVVQDVFVVACKNPSKVRVDNEIGWLKKTAHNLMLTASRKKRGKSEVSYEPTIELADMDADVFFKLSVEALLNVLPQKDYNLIYDHAVRGKTVPELSQELSVTPNSVNIRITRIRKKLREYYSENFV